MNKQHIFLIVTYFFGSLLSLSAGVASQGAREAAEFFLKKMGKKASQESVEHLSRQFGKATLKYGDQALPFLRRTGDDGLVLLREMSESQAKKALRLVSNHGDDATRILMNPASRKLFLRYGDDAARALIKHPGIADKLIVAHGNRGTQALLKVSRRGAQRLGMLSKDGLFSATKESRKLLDVVANDGDKAVKFILNHKALLLTTAGVVVFLKSPDAFINEGLNLASVVGKHVGMPLLERVKCWVNERNWRPLLVAFGAIFTGMWGIKRVKNRLFGRA